MSHNTATGHQYVPSVSPRHAQQSPPADSAVQVAVRIRPVSNRELGSNASGHNAIVCRAHPTISSTIQLEPGRGVRASRKSGTSGSEGETLLFTYDYVFDDNDTDSVGSLPEAQQRVFDVIGEQVVQNAINGYNVSLLAYGQTGSGKTCSMLGPGSSGSTSQNGENSGLEGLIPRILTSLFAVSKHDTESAMHSIECSYIEIYSEKIRDLLDSRKKNLKVRENPKTGPYIEDCSLIACNSERQCMALLRTGNLERTVAATNMNSESSRSHAVFTIVFTSTRVDDATKLSTSVVSKIHLVDLAGSERVDHSGATGVRLKEASNINKSLTTLGRVVQALAQRSEQQSQSQPTSAGKGHVRRSSALKKPDEVFVPFRDSVLTWLLKESLGGNSKTIMLACVSPIDFNCEETLSTLRYASRAKNIVNRAIVNEDPNAELIRQLRAEIETLKKKLEVQMAQPQPSSAQSSDTTLVAGDSDAGNAHESELVSAKEAEMSAMAASIATLKAELSRSSASIATINKEWETKLAKAQELEALRLAEIKNRGISMIIDRELPFFVNLNEDPSLNESLVYHLHSGVTVIGSRKKPLGDVGSGIRSDRVDDGRDSGNENDSDNDSNGDDAMNTTITDTDHPHEHRIVLAGFYVTPDHCRIINVHNTVSIEPMPLTQGSETHVNGESLTHVRELKHGDRVVIGSQHFFRFSRAKQRIDWKVTLRKKLSLTPKIGQRLETGNAINDNTSESLSPRASPASSISEGGEPDNYFDFEFAQNELIGNTNTSAGGKSRATASINTSHFREEDDSAAVLGDQWPIMTRDTITEPSSAPPALSPPITPTAQSHIAISGSEVMTIVNHSNESQSIVVNPLPPPLSTWPPFTVSLTSVGDIDNSAAIASYPLTETDSPISPFLTVLTANQSQQPIKLRPQTAPTSSATGTNTDIAVPIMRKDSSGDVDDAQIAAPTFHLGRDIRHSVDYLSKRAVTKSELEEWIAQDRALLAKHQQKTIVRHERLSMKFMQPLHSCSVFEYKAINETIYKWRWFAIKQALQEEVKRLVFLCDEANAITGRLGRPERYKVELCSFHNVLPEILLSLLPLTNYFSQPQSSPLQRLRQLKIVFCQVVEVRRRQLPLPVLAFDLASFHEQLIALRHLCNEMIEGEADDSRQSLSPMGQLRQSSVSLSAPPASLLSLPSSELYTHPQLLGRALCFLHALRFGHSIRHAATILDERGEICGTLNIEMEICSVDETIARKEMNRDDKMHAKQEREEELRRQQATASEEHDSENDSDDSDCDDDEDTNTNTSSTDTPNDAHEFVHSHRMLSVLVKAPSVDFHCRHLSKMGLKSFWLKYHVKDQTFAYRSARVSVTDSDSRYQLDYSHTHYFTGMDLQQLCDWLTYDALIVEVWCKVEDPAVNHRTSVSELQGVRTHSSRQSITLSPSLLPPASASINSIPSSPTVAAGHHRSMTSGVLSSSDGLMPGHQTDSNSDSRPLAVTMPSPLNRSFSESQNLLGSPLTPERPMLGRQSSLSINQNSRKSVLSKHSHHNSSISQLPDTSRPSSTDNGVWVDNGKKCIDHLLYVACDLEEELPSKPNSFASCLIKEDKDATPVFRLSQQRRKRVVLSLAQVDHKPFVIEKLSSMRASSLTLTRHGGVVQQSLFTDAASIASHVMNFPIIDQFPTADHKLLLVTLAWPKVLEDHALLNTVSQAGERVALTLRAELYFSASTVPVVLTLTMHNKIYKMGEKSSMFGAKLKPLTDSDRIVKLGVHCCITRHSSPQTVGNVFREHELVLEQIQRRMASQYQLQHKSLIQKLSQTTPQMADALVQATQSSADSLTKRYTLRFSRIIADLRSRSGIEMSVEPLNPQHGVKSGYLNERISDVSGRQHEPRWSVLRPPFLFLYDKRDDRKERTLVRLMKADISTVRGDSTEFTIQQVGGSASVTLQAANDVDLQAWLKALNAPAAAPALTIGLPSTTITINSRIG